MGFCGKPSTACFHCRQKRLKCSREQPSCKQCIRKGVKCVGYIDPDALRIRDETIRVTKKLQQNSSEGPSTSRVSHHDQSTVSFKTNVKDTKMNLGSTTHSTWDLATSFFFRSYISTTLFELYLPQIYAAEPDADDACSSAITAAAYAAYAKHTKQCQHVVTAQQKYVEALSRLNAVLQDPQKARSDRTLTTTMMLALFEAINFKAGEAPTAWINHTLGMVELLKYRRQPSSESSTSALLLGHAILSVRVMYVLTLKVVPSDISRFVQCTKPFFELSQPPTILDPLLENFSRLGVKIKGDYRCLLFLQASDIERQIAEFSTSVFTTVLPCLDDLGGPQNRPQLPGGYIYRSRSLRFAKLWNAVHLMRICLTDPTAKKTLGSYTDSLDDFQGKGTYVSTGSTKANLDRLHQRMKSIDSEITEDLITRIPISFDCESPSQSFLSPTLDLE